MSRRFLYYFPTLPGINSALLAKHGLLDRFESSRGESLPYMVSGCDQGPDGQSGCIVGTGSQPCLYQPDRQTWAMGEKFCVGIEQPWPGPDDLAREIGITGAQTELSDGKVWRVPVLHRWDEGLCRHVANLPKSMRPLPGGGCEIVVRPEFRAADELASDIYSAFVAGRTVPADEAFHKAVAVLNVNYRIGPEEAGLLGVLNESDVVRILGIAVDIPTLQNQALSMSTDGMEYVEPLIRDEE